MSEEKREILEHLVEYLQDKIDTGYHKIFYNDDMYDEKTIDCINAIDTTLKEIERLNNIIDELEKWLNEWKNWIDRPDEFEDGIISCINDTLYKIKELKGSDKE